jgi:hypothetical protein
MVAPLETCTREEQCSVILFLSSEGVNSNEMHSRRMKTQYGDACLSLQQVYEWGRKFNNVDRPCLPHTGSTPETVKHGERVI